MLERAKATLAWIVRCEPLVVLALAPFFIFPRPTLTPWLMAVVPLLWLARGVVRGAVVQRTPLNPPLLVMAAMVGVSALATFDPLRSFPKVAAHYYGVALLFAVVNAVRTRRAIWLAAGAILAGGAAMAAASLVGTQWPTKVPWITALLAPLYRGLPALIRGLPRAERGFNPNEVGGALTLFIPLALVLVGHLFNCAKLQARWLLAFVGTAFALTLLTLVLLLTQCRLAYLVTAMVPVLLGLSRRGWTRWLAVAALVIAIGGVAYLGPQTVAHAVFDVGSADSLVTDTSWQGRVEIWSRALRVIEAHPITGIGFDTLVPIVHARFPMLRAMPTHNFCHSHNLYMQVALDLGLPGLVGFCALLLVWGAMMVQVRRDAPSAADRALATGLLFGVVAWGLYGLADAISLGHKPAVFVWAYWGLGAALWLRTRREPQRQP